MLTRNYYPETSEGRADWWQNVLENGAAALAALGFPEEKVAGILNDAAWAVYTYGKLHSACERYRGEVAEYISAVAAGTDGTTEQMTPELPKTPVLPEAPKTKIKCDFEQRRLKWIEEARSSAGYTHEIGEALGLVPFPKVFDPWSFRTELHGLVCAGPKTVSGKFRKVYGNIDGIVLRGRPHGSAGWTELGRFTATPFSAAVPVGGEQAQEVWEFQARALKHDLEVGVPTELIEVPVEA